MISITYLKTYYVPNGDIETPINVYECDICHDNILESDWHHREKEKHFCMDCAFKNGLVEEKEYLNSIGIGLNTFHAGINNGEIIIWMGKKTPPWERTKKQQRNSVIYKNWRKSVFERDNYICQDCGQIGGELNAHHIKSFAEYKKLRYEISNGTTLCVSCHKKRHKKSG